MEEFFILKFPDGKLVALDDASGGYPYPAEQIWAVKRFRSAEDANRYRQASNNREGFTIHKATLTLSTELIEV